MVSVNKKVAIGMSGGVDSSVAAALLKEQGFDVCAVTMVTYDGSEPEKENQRHGCYGPGEAEDVASAESVCKKLDIALHVIDLREEYQTHVIGHFRNEYLAGRTPNPCVVCNREVKFGFLLEKARKSGVEFDFFATGHYAIIERSDGRYSLKRGKDHSKDQSYFLYTLTPNQLSTTLFPLGTYKKPQVR
ncbi:MAG: tRNA 2-thiouridine(34) synthase MnmA, partial [Deltaproteobacteria bacterium]|nr:tRNA 2-thiouridine(34) synthase MnmA [Deltaproteobacteria bacterium]